MWETIGAFFQGIVKSFSAGGRVSAKRGGVAAGRDIRESTIHIGLDEQEVQRRIIEAQRPLTEGLSALADKVALEKGVPAASLRSILGKLGEASVPDHEIPKRLDALADQLLELRRTVLRSTTDRPEFAAIRQQVLDQLNRGDLDGARLTLQRGRASAHELHLEREETELIANEALIDQLQLNYRAAARKYADAANLVARFDPDGVWGLLMHQAGALAAQGAEFGDTGALTDAIAIYKQCVTPAPRPKRPLDWATSQNSLGVALSRLGERQTTTESLREAVEAYEESLKECTRERAPLNWAMTKNNIGNVLTDLGQRENDVALLESAVTAFGDALQECTRELNPLEWANIQTNLGTTLQVIGKRETGTQRLEQSVECYQAALTERTQERVPLEWATTQNNLGNTFGLLAERERSIDRLKASIERFLNALKERTAERVPLDWAMTAGNLGMDLVRFGAIEGNPSRIQSGIDALLAALSVFEELGAERFVAGTRKNLATAQMVLSACVKAVADSNSTKS